MWGGAPPPGYYAPPGTGGAPVGGPPSYGPAYPTAAAPYASYGAGAPSMDAGGSALAFPSPADPYGGGGTLPVMPPTLESSFGAMSIGGYGNAGGYAGYPPPTGPVGPASGGYTTTITYLPSSSSSSSCSPCGPPSSCTPPSSCGSPYVSSPAVSPYPSGGMYVSGGYVPPATAPTYYAPHAAPAYPLPTYVPSAGMAQPPAYGSASPAFTQSLPSMPPSSHTSGGPPLSTGAPYYVARPTSPQAAPIPAPVSRPPPSATLSHMAPVSSGPSPQLYSSSGSNPVQPQTPYPPRTTSPQPISFCSTADCYGPSSGSYTVPPRHLPAAPASSTAAMPSSISYPQLPHAPPASSPAPSLGSSSSTALPPSLHRTNTSSGLEAIRQREREKEQEQERQNERERRAIIGNISTLPQRVQDAVNQVSPKDLKALQEQFSTLMLASTDTKISANEFASRTGFRPDSALVKFLFGLLDLDKNGFITEVDFLCSMAFFMKGDKRERLEWVFETLDTNGDGVLDEMEINEVVLSMYQTLTAMGVNAPMTSLMPFLNGIFAGVPAKRPGALHQTINKEQFIQLGLSQPRFLQGLGLLGEGKGKRVGKRGTPVSLVGSSWKTCFYLMIGLRISLQMAKDDISGEPSTADFKAVNTFELAKTDLTKAETWTFTDYAPLVFKKFRAMCGIDETDYLLALGPEQVFGNLLRGELSTPSVQLSDGKSGSFFYYSHDGRFLVKTIPMDECTSLFQILQGYYEHFQRYPDSLIGRFFGLHKINQTAFVVMENVFQTNIPIHRVYDLKGSTVNRSTQGEGVQKDMDLNQLFFFDAETRSKIVSQLHKDSEFLCERYLMDYSLLVGIHFLNYPDIECRPVDHSVRPKVSAEEVAAAAGETVPFFRRDYGGIQGRKKDGTPLSEIYFIGVIDILTTYSTIKSAENFVKSLFVNKHAISAVPPDEYSSRFKNYITTIFE